MNFSNKYSPLYIISCVASLFLLCFPHLIAQDTIRAEHFFSRALGDSTVESITNKSKVKFPIIEEYNLRSETSDFDFGKQEYSFRIYPNNRYKRRAQKDIYKHLNSMPDFEAEEKQCEQKLEANADWLNLFFWNNKLSLIEELEIIYSDKELILENKLRSLQASSKDIIEYNKDKNDLALLKFENQNELEYLYNKYGFESTLFSFDDFIRVSQIPEAINKEESFWSGSNVKENEFDLALIEKELALEKAENNQFFDFAQLRYQGPHSDIIQERLSIGVGVKLSTSGSSKLKMEELKLDKLRLEAKVINEGAALEKKLSDLNLELKKELSYYNFYSQLIDEEAAYQDILSENLLLHSDFNPLDILKIKERKIKNQIEKIQLARDIYELYLEFSYKSGKICIDSQKNVLSNPSGSF